MYMTRAVKYEHDARFFFGYGGTFYKEVQYFYVGGQLERTAALMAVNKIQHYLGLGESV